MTDAYQNILRELESYLQGEISEWYNLARVSGDKGEMATVHALNDIRLEIQRLKELYLSR